MSVGLLRTSNLHSQKPFPTYGLIEKETNTLNDFIHKKFNGCEIIA